MADRLRGFGFVDDVRYGREWIEKLDRLRNIAGVVGLTIGLAFAAVAVVIIGVTIRITVLQRAREIAIMRLVGATNGFIRGPFLLEGALKGLPRRPGRDRCCAYGTYLLFRGSDRAGHLGHRLPQVRRSWCSAGVRGGDRAGGEPGERGAASAECVGVSGGSGGSGGDGAPAASAAGAFVASAARAHAGLAGTLTARTAHRPGRTSTTPAAGSRKSAGSATGWSSSGAAAGPGP